METTLNRTASRSSFGEGASSTERPLAMLFQRVRRATSQLEEQSSMLADAKMSTLSRMIGEPGPEPTSDQVAKPAGPGRQLHFGGDFAELEDAVVTLENTVSSVIERERYVTNRLTNIG